MAFVVRFLDKCAFDSHFEGCQPYIESKNKPSTCKECGNDFSTVFELTHHLKNIHFSHDKFVCDFCDKDFSHPQLVELHKLGVHKALENPENFLSTNDEKKKMYQCCLCGKTFGELLHFKKHHRIVHKMKNQNWCDFCEKEYSKPEHLEIHLNVGYGEHECNFCKTLFLQKCAKEVHIQNCSDKTEDSTFQCNFCGKEFTKENVLEIHIATSHKGEKLMNGEPQITGKDFKCNICEEQFDEESVLLYHMELYHGSDDQNENNENFDLHQCDLCDKTFRQVNNFKKHYQEAHDMSKKTECESCGKIFKQPSFLRMHLRMAFGKTFADMKCEFCNRLFLQACSYGIHVRNCNKKPIFPCNHCDKQFSKESYLKTHLESIEAEVETEIEQPPMHGIEQVDLNCDFCENTFENVDDFKIHHQEEHVRVMAEKSKCDICDQEFPLPTHLKTHLQKGNVESNCEFCNQLLLQRCGKDFHRKKCTKKPQIKCIDCLQIFTTKEQIDEHDITHEIVFGADMLKPKNSQIPSEDIETFDCQNCVESFENMYDLKIHERECHDGIFLTCETCNVSYTDKKKFDKHRKYSEIHLRRNLWHHFYDHTCKKEGFDKSDVTGFFEKLFLVHRQTFTRINAATFKREQN